VYAAFELPPPKPEPVGIDLLTVILTGKVESLKYSWINFAALNAKFNSLGISRFGEQITSNSFAGSIIIYIVVAVLAFI
jgi:hypothetical protein